ncbi:MAG: hypothetical protein OH319_01545 [Candidatus Parvarchaeota archaeon]|nr:hypothetical protein [Candidatus Jingweiarchaeum tengchongense]MCW1297745.1 hypothetical protein [Candidatus Jingweiarchaeum tengchongense]MCW1299755.1 hypothetical protein [Candidatus Jingweiarchaeum tengchongense]MCW1304274.1 hypothetical protein [Candidatus Jingweiarchaeum tengchongense]MCW1305302.1 hypothetical protein [Candidatus Jingweiarchaeum tengchongense]
MRLLFSREIGKKGVEETTKQIVLLIIFAIVLIAFILALLPNLQAVTWGQFVSAFNTYHLTIVKAIAYKQSLAGPMNVPDGFFIIQIYGGDTCQTAMNSLALATQGQISSYAGECADKFCICGGRLGRSGTWYTKQNPWWIRTTSGAADSFPDGFSDALAECGTCTTYDQAKQKLNDFCYYFFWEGYYGDPTAARQIFTGLICHALTTPSLVGPPPFIATNITSDSNYIHPLMFIYKKGGVTIQSHYVEKQETEAYYLNSSFVIY